MKAKYILLLFVVTVALSGCKKFLDVKPKGVIIPEKLADYDGLLNSPTLTGTFPVDILNFTDDYQGSFDQINASSDANGYFWRPIINIDEKLEPVIWGPLYNRIYSTNVIINGVMAVNDGSSDADRKKVLGEALVIRASCYMDLLTVFAKSYNPATAATDPGLPMPTSLSVTGKSPARASLKTTIDAMISDIKSAVEMLPSANVNRYRVTQYVAYGLLSRIYLYMADFANSKIYTDLALQAPHNLLDYNNYNSSFDVTVTLLNGETLWQRTGVNRRDAAFMVYSPELTAYFNDDDLRLEFLAGFTNDGLVRYGFFVTYNFGITFPELYLTRAELLAREGKFNEAMDIVNMLRKKRIRTSAYTDQSASSGEESLIKVLAERRRELAFCGPRWFDMKRLDQEGRMPKVERVNRNTNNVEATLPPQSPKYTFEIPVRVQKFNPDMVLNHK